MNRIFTNVYRFGLNHSVRASILSNVRTFSWNTSASRLTYKTNLSRHAALLNANAYRCLHSNSNDKFQKLSLGNEQDDKGDFNDSSQTVQEFNDKHQVFSKGTSLDPVFDFHSLDLPPKLIQLMDEFEYKHPSPIQSLALPILLDGQDLIGIAQTGSGKTLAYLLPALKKFFPIHRDYWTPKDSYNDDYSSNKETKLNPKVLVLAPTRELALQIFSVIRQFKIFKAICLYGGSDRRKQVSYLQTNTPLILVSTPGRLKDLVDDEMISLKDISYLVVDEADRMLDMGFEPQISYLIRRCPRKSDRQTMMFSASWPEEVQQFVNKYLRPEHAFVSVGGTKLVANHNIVQHIDVCQPDETMHKLQNILHNHKNDKIIIFTNTKSSCSRLTNLIRNRLNMRAAPLHGDLTQSKREQTISDFKDNQFQVLCATNVAARGIDIDNVNVVINFDFPTDIETYVHRIGRTGRKNNTGHAYSFFTDETNSSLARNLIDILVESKNEVPSELSAIASANRSGGKFKSKQYSNRMYDDTRRNRVYNNYNRSGNRY